MNPLNQFAPRPAGSAPLEPITVFAESVEAAGAQRCPMTSVCFGTDCHYTRNHQEQ